MSERTAELLRETFHSWDMDYKIADLVADVLARAGLVLLLIEPTPEMLDEMVRAIWAKHYTEDYDDRAEGRKRWCRKLARAAYRAAVKGGA